MKAYTIEEARRIMDNCHSFEQFSQIVLAFKEIMIHHRYRVACAIAYEMRKRYQELKTLDGE